MKTNTVNGYTFLITNPNDVIQRKLVKGTQWNRWVVDELKSLQHTLGLKHLVNAGAHIGTIAIPMTGTFDQVTVFEPFPPTWDHLQQNIALNDIDNIACHNLALGNREDTVYFLDPKQIPNNTGGIHSVTATDIKQGRKSSHLHTREWSRPMTTLDRVNIDEFDTLLLDVEGTEYELLQGATHSLDCVRVLITEIWDDDKRTRERLTTTQEQVIDYVTSLGFTYRKHKKDDWVFTRES